MPAWTTTGSLADSLNDMVSAARIVREFEGVMPNLVDRKRLGEGIGLSWNEITLDQLVGQRITETTDLENNPQQLSDSKITVTPYDIGIHIFVTERVRARISKESFVQSGPLAQNAIQRYKDEEGLDMLDAATTSLCGAGSTLTVNHIGAAVTRITSNLTEPGPKPIRCVLHGYQIKDLIDDLISGVGSMVVSDGPTARVLTEGWTIPILGVEVYEDGNIVPDGSDDAKGGVFSQMGIMLIEGRTLRHYTDFKPGKGGGGTSVYIYDEFAYGERSVGNWVYEIYSDATAPTS